MNRNLTHLIQRLRLMAQRWKLLKERNASVSQLNALYADIKRLYYYLSARLHRRTLRRALGVTFALLGLGLSSSVQAQSFAPPVSSPFGLSYSGQTYLVATDLVDLDDDGDLDVVGAPYYSQSAYFWENTGTSASPDFSTAPSVLSGSQLGLYTVSVDLADMDGDGDYDMITGEYYGVTKYFENTGSASSPAFDAPVLNPFGMAQNSYISFPNIVDLDDDGDFDLAIGEAAGSVRFYENTGTPTSPTFGTSQLNPFGLDTTNLFNNPEFVDLDADGDYDLLSGEYYGGVVYFENEGSASIPAFSAPISSPFGLVGLPNSYFTAFTSGDLDNDGDMDLIVSDYGGIFRYYENTLFNVGQEEFADLNVTVFPNPASDVLNIESNGIEVEQITLFDLRGSLMLNSAYHGQSIPLDDLPPGVYQLHIHTDRGVQIEKLMVN